MRNIARRALLLQKRRMERMILAIPIGTAWLLGATVGRATGAISTQRRQQALLQPGDHRNEHVPTTTSFSFGDEGGVEGEASLSGRSEKETVASSTILGPGDARIVQEVATSGGLLDELEETDNDAPSSSLGVSDGGGIHLDGRLSDWTPQDSLMVRPDLEVPNFELYGRAATTDALLIALQSTGGDDDVAVAHIGPGSTIWLNTDQDPTTGFQVWGSKVGAEYNVNVDFDGTPYLYTGGAAETFVLGPLNHAFDDQRTTLEVEIPLRALGSVAADAIDVALDVNNDVFLPTGLEGHYTVPLLALPSSDDGSTSQVDGDVPTDSLGDSAGIGEEAKEKGNLESTPIVEVTETWNEEAQEGDLESTPIVEETGTWNEEAQEGDLEPTPIVEDAETWNEEEQEGDLESVPIVDETETWNEEAQGVDLEFTPMEETETWNEEAREGDLESTQIVVEETETWNEEAQEGDLESTPIVVEETETWNEEAQEGDLESTPIVEETETWNEEAKEGDLESTLLEEESETSNEEAREGDLESTLIVEETETWNEEDRSDDLPGWTDTNSLMISPELEVDNIELYGKSTPDSLLLAVSSPDFAIGPGSTIYLNTDQDPKTGFLVWGSKIGAEYNVNFNVYDGKPYLYTGSVAEDFVFGPLNHTFGFGPLNHTFNDQRTTLEIEVPTSLLGEIGTGVDLALDINNGWGEIFLPTLLEGYYTVYFDTSSKGNEVSESMQKVFRVGEIWIILLCILIVVACFIFWYFAFFKLRRFQESDHVKTCPVENNVLV